jgi:hypothetical protein
VIAVQGLFGTSVSSVKLGLLKEEQNVEGTVLLIKFGKNQITHAGQGATLVVRTVWEMILLTVAYV